jgi:hypothetical protein
LGVSYLELIVEHYSTNMPIGIKDFLVMIDIALKRHKFIAFELQASIK